MKNKKSIFAEFIQEITHPQVRQMVAETLRTKTFWVLLGVGFGLSYCLSRQLGFTLEAPTHFAKNFAVHWVYITTLILIALVDLKYSIIPSMLVYPLLVAGLILAPVTHMAFLGALILGGGFWLIRFLVSLATKQEAMGQGDVKLAAALGAWVGPAGIVPLLIVTSLGALLMLVCRRICKQPAEHTPFGPYLALGGWVAYAYGNAAMFWVLFVPFYISLKLGY